MNILHITPVFITSLHGGVAVAAYELTKRLAGLGHSITVFTTTDSHSKTLRITKDNILIENINIKYFKNLSGALAYKYKVFLSPGMFLELNRSLQNFDIIHLHMLRTIQNICAYHEAIKRKVPYIIHLHGSLSVEKRLKRVKVFYDRLIGYKILNGAAKIIALTNSEALKLKFLGISPDKIEIIPNGIDLSRYSSLPRAGSFREKYNIPIDKKIVLYLGRITANKRLDLLLRAFKIFDSHYSGKALLVIAGPDDGYMHQLNRLIKELDIASKTLLLGYLDETLKMECLTDSDVLVIPAFVGFPLTILEQLACGKPVIITDKHDVIEGIHNNVGLVVKPDEKALSDALSNILLDDNKYESLRKNAIKFVRNFDWFSIAQRVDRVYKHVLDLSRK
jgi:glycosyltransferase involved in cell wall biosynthesis